MSHSLNKVNDRIRAEKAAEEAAIEAALASGKCIKLIPADKKTVEKASRISRHVDAYFDDAKSKEVVDTVGCKKKGGIVFKPLDPLSKWTA